MKMICEHCGTQNPDNTRICTHCGMPIGKCDEQNTIKKEVTEIKTSKNVMKKKSLLLVIGIPLALYLIGQIFGGKTGESMNENSQSKSSVMESGNSATTEEKVDNPEYTKIFDERKIIKMPLITLGEKASFAKVDVDEDGIEEIYCMDFAYDGKTGIISAMTETFYTDIKDLTEEDKKTLDTQMQEKFKKYADLENFNATGAIDNQYYRAVYEYKNLNDKNVIKNFKDLELITTDGKETDFFGIEPTEKELLEEGYIKR